MKKLLLTIFCSSTIFTYSQKTTEKQNIIIITTDGFRWQEVFKGADSAFICNPDLVTDSTLIRQQYWDTNQEIRRQKLMPFFWNVIAKQGQLYGNRDLSNKVNITNPYKISYAGYSEILTGHSNLKFNPNLAVKNKSINVLEYLNSQQEYKGRIAAFSSWNVIPFVLNEHRSNFPVNGGYELLDENEDSSNIAINKVQQEVVKQKNTRHDLLTFASAKAYIRHKHPKVTFISFGETDEYAHQDQYDLYLQKANQVDRMIGDLWYYVQTDPFYKGNTTFIITTDHGRGRKASTWHTHGLFTKGSGDTWLAMIGSGIIPKGEMRVEQQVFGKQIAQTVASMLGLKFTANHPVSEALNLPSTDIYEKPINDPIHHVAFRSLISETK